GYSKLADQEKELEKSLREFQQLHPRPFKGAQTESEEAEKALGKAAESMQKRSAESRQAAQKATEQLEKLGEAMQGKSAGQQLANAYKLKQMLDQQIQTLDRHAQGDEK